jgi:FKBP-type peptidyl-prolyl cis-trans isomerase FkpA
MAEVTRVPLQPIAKGSVLRLWLGIVAVLLIAAALAWWAMPKGVQVSVLQEGTGEVASDGDVLFVKYTGKLADGTVFDASQETGIPEGIFPEGVPFPLEEGATIPGFYQGLQQVRSGGRYEITIPAQMAYGAEPPPGSPIPPNSDLTFEIEVTGIMTRADFDQRLQRLQQQMMSGLGGEGEGEGAPGGE